MKTKPYLGYKRGPDHTLAGEVFRSATVPTQASHGDTYLTVVGPFRTARAARYMRDNPYVETVQNAERLAKALTE